VNLLTLAEHFVYLRDASGDFVTGTFSSQVQRCEVGLVRGERQFAANASSPLR
jgi:hypothetical protein